MKSLMIRTLSKRDNIKKFYYNEDEVDGWYKDKLVLHVEVKK
jgi:hypothetical protein